MSSSQNKRQRDSLSHHLGVAAATAGLIASTLVPACSRHKPEPPKPTEATKAALVTKPEPAKAVQKSPTAPPPNAKTKAKPAKVHMGDFLRPQVADRPSARRGRDLLERKAVPANRPGN